jgi:hypothetical protein
MSDVTEVYNRCGSCRHFRVEYTDRLMRTMGTCQGRPGHPTAAAHEFGCPEYHLDRQRLMPGTCVPADADMSPYQREQQRRSQFVQDARRHAPPTRSRPTRDRDDDAPAAKLREIPLDFTTDEGETMDRDALKSILSEVLDEALGLSDVPMHPRYRGGTVIVRPANPELASKELDVDVLFRKVVSIRDKLRVLEQKVNASNLDGQEKVQLQTYVTGCYGSLTSFNFLFKDRDDGFTGAGSD